MGRKPAKAECGTRPGYMRHVTLGEPVDQACLDAHNEYMRQFRANNPDKVEEAKRRARIRHRALVRLAELHPADYAILEYDETMKAEAEQ
jgi:hypothetical protein